MNKKIFLTLTVITTTLITCIEKSALNNYANKKYIDSNKKILSFYCEPIIATKMLINNDSTVKKISFSDSFQEIGHIHANNIIIYKDAKDTMNFKFNKVTFYRTKTNGDSFSIMYIKATHNKEKYEIILELRDPSKENRMLFVYKKGTPIIIISFIDYILKYSVRFYNAI